MARYRLFRNVNHFEGGVRLNVGDVIEMDDARYASLRDRFELVDSEEIDLPDDSDFIEEVIEVVEPEIVDDMDDEEYPEDDEPESRLDIPDLSKLRWPEAKEAVRRITDPEVLIELLSTERRKSVVPVIESQLNSLLG